MLIHPTEKLAVYEPPISINGSFPFSWLSDFEKAIERNQVKKAMAISLKGLRVQEDINKLPFWAILLLINILTLIERKKEKGIRMLDLLPTLTPDIRMAMQLHSTFVRYKHLSIPVLLMVGQKVPLTLRMARTYEG